MGRRALRRMILKGPARRSTTPVHQHRPFTTLPLRHLDRHKPRIDPFVAHTLHARAVVDEASHSYSQSVSCLDWSSLFVDRVIRCQGEVFANAITAQLAPSVPPASMVLSENRDTKPRSFPLRSLSNLTETPCLDYAYSIYNGHSPYLLTQRIETLLPTA
ncbi:hypothetical protein BDZ97DRAFT_2071601 [Flammula alnicola]|nr:hypothetical protein BDZ97DRAFT_2071601 [Flammula alnicola]